MTKVIEEYKEIVDKQVKTSQESGDIPMDYVYSFKDKTFLLTLPQSVMAQKRLLFLMTSYLNDPTFENEERLLREVTKQTKVNGVPVNIEQLELGEIEVLKTAYMDGLLLPLFRGGETAVEKFMQATVQNLGLK